jgi:hypothetical protein
VCKSDEIIIGFPPTTSFLEDEMAHVSPTLAFLAILARNVLDKSANIIVSSSFQGNLAELGQVSILLEIHQRDTLIFVLRGSALVLNSKEIM